LTNVAQVSDQGPNRECGFGPDDDRTLSPTIEDIEGPNVGTAINVHPKGIQS